MSTIGIIGSGNIGATIARLAIQAGHDVVLSNSRSPQTLWPLAAALGPKARTATPEEAGQAGELILVSVPLHRYRDVPAEPLTGKLVLDTGNYYPDRDGRIAELDSGQATTSSLLQVHLADAQVVKVFNNIWFHHLGILARTSDSPERSTLPVAGDDSDAKASAQALVDQLGYDTYDAGTLADSWRFERDQPAYVTPYGPFDVAAAATPVSTEGLARVLAQATR